MRIGILTFHRAYNCGAMLQAWALKKTLERMGHTVEFPACNHVGETPRWGWYEWCNREKSGLSLVKSILGRLYLNIKLIPDQLASIPSADRLRRLYRDFRTSHLPERECEPNEFARFYDVLISGSDQVFNADICKSDLPLFLCETKPSTLRAITYAASYGDHPLKGCVLDRVKTALANFSALSMRETMACRQLEEVSGRKIEEVVDPTLLLTAEDYDEIARGKVSEEPYLFLYTVYRSRFIYQTAQELARRLGVKCVIGSCYQTSRWGAPRGWLPESSPDRLVQYARHAKYVLASSFHGTVMGVIFGKQFLSIREKVDTHESRPAALLRKLGCPERLVNPSTSLDEMERLLRESQPSCSDLLEKERAASLAWLKSAIIEKGSL